MLSLCLFPLSSSQEMKSDKLYIMSEISKTHRYDRHMTEEVLDSKSDYYSLVRTCHILMEHLHLGPPPPTLRWWEIQINREIKTSTSPTPPALYSHCTLTISQTFLLLVTGVSDCTIRVSQTSVRNILIQNMND